MAVRAWLYSHSTSVSRIMDWHWHQNGQVSIQWALAHITAIQSLARSGIKWYPQGLLLFVSVGSARQRYHAYLDEQNAARQNEESKNKRKCLFDEVKEIKTKKKRILADIESLNKTADKLAEKAERTGQIPLIMISPTAWGKLPKRRMWS